MNSWRFCKENSYRFVPLFLSLILILSGFQILAESTTTKKEITPLQEREALEDELRQLEEQIIKYEEDIQESAAEKKTLQNQIYILKTQINKLNLQIQQSNVMIQDLGIQITDTENSIEQTSLKINDSRGQLAAILRTIYEQDQKSLIEILLAEGKLSGFFNDLMALETLDVENREVLDDIKELKDYLENQQQSLDEEKADLERIVQIQSLQKQENETAQQGKNYLLKLTEEEYQQSLKEKEAVEKRAAEIRSRIFELIGVPEAPTFGEALAIAEYVERVTGVRPALLLAVLTQESNIGKNVGQCFLKNPTTGAGVISYNGKAVSNVMKPSRDVQPFLQITKELGRDPYNTAVSCPMSFGYGGAMGPAQFIPSTWMLYRDRLKEITGRPADPWDIKDAFLAAGLYLSDYGAANQTYNSEWKAAMIYFSGSTNLRYRFYGDSVMSIAAGYEEDIRSLD
jgi:membrane-bound lytic murein transglycosylase B